jgi:hypothetical protein
MSKTTWTIILILIGSVSFAGRPVFHDLTLEQITAKSDAVLIVEKVKPFQLSERKLAGNCVELSWPLKVKEVLKNKTKEHIEVGKSISVIVNATAIFDCSTRIDNPTGVSFAAERYVPSTPLLLDNIDMFIIFVRADKKQIHLIAQDSIEQVLRKEEILKMISQSD